MMKSFNYLLRLLYRVWFYILAAIPIIVFFPILIVLSLIPRGFPMVYWIARNLWAPVILYGMGTPIKLEQEIALEKGTSYMICPNHQSMLDIMIVLRISKNPVVFVGNEELKSIPLFGHIYKNVSVLVDRSQKNSRAQVYTTVKEKLQEGHSIGVFPEGMVPPWTELMREFKPGAFKMAIEHQLKVVPVSIYNAKDRLPYEFDHGKPGRLRVKIHSPIETGHLNHEDYSSLREQCRFVLEQDLIRDRDELLKK